MNESFPTGNFRRHEIVTHSGNSSKVREIFIPDEHTMNKHLRTLEMMYDSEIIDNSTLPANAWVDGGLPGTQLMDSVLPHKDNWTFYKLDIKNAFPNVDAAVLWEELQQRLSDFSRWEEFTLNLLLEHFIDNYATTPAVSGLPLGAPASPYLFNFYCQPMDKLLAAFCAEEGLTYTRYLDDITISSPKKNHTLGEDTRQYIRQIVESRPGFKINHAKSRLLHREKSHITLTGIALYPDGRIQPRPELIDKTMSVFEDIFNEVALGHKITASHVGIVDGYHGVLKSMSQEPYNATMRKAFKEYHLVAGLVRAAIAQDEEPEYVRDTHPEKTQIAEDLLMKVMHGDEAAIAWIAENNPLLWRILLQNGLVNTKPSSL